MRMREKERKRIESKWPGNTLDDTDVFFFVGVGAIFGFGGHFCFFFHYYDLLHRINEIVVMNCEVGIKVQIVKGYSRVTSRDSAAKTI